MHTPEKFLKADMVFVNYQIEERCADHFIGRSREQLLRCSGAVCNDVPFIQLDKDVGSHKSERNEAIPLFTELLPQETFRPPFTLTPPFAVPPLFRN